MTALQIWSVADQVRRQLMPRPNMPQLDLERVVRLAMGMKVNGTDIAIHWDLERAIRDGQGAPRWAWQRPIRHCLVRFSSA